MKSNFYYLFPLLFIILLFFYNEVQGQSKEQLELEYKRNELQTEIKKISRLLFTRKQEKKSIVSKVEDLDYKISVRKNLINVINQEANLITRQINNNEDKILSKKEKLTLLKKDYADMVVRSYKHRARDNKLMFLLSASDFQQAYRRLQYISQYTQFQKNLSKNIRNETKLLEQLNLKLLSKKAEKEKLIAENRAAKLALDEELREQEELIVLVQNNLIKFSTQIKLKQSESEKLDRQIQKLILDAIAESNKNRTKPSARFSLTPEQQQLADNFVSNKGKLPWPVESGIVKLRFGTKPSPIDPTIKIKSNGVRIATNEGEQVRAVFDGTVQSIMTPKNGNNTIMIKHGNYITIYKNLSKFFVTKGDKVTTRQIIGEVITNAVSGESILSFGIYKDSSVQDPSLWIYKL